ncbi:uncharacterized protein LY89DRAFT_257390 [Mollisia scopiformis]|uniref:SAP domain-containing protein n=1 Tax=Mollisia scopiformis TaxID=149040 RepID=A0A132BD05_MOLSC|nr:uncharacterized protein LY89DRAFT_257390 [Mollisia scopiformis]KUJ10312.1 hypothetical protein LY89DRAFT_257390 [Mollisia scopiformis]
MIDGVGRGSLYCIAFGRQIIFLRAFLVLDCLALHGIAKVVDRTEYKNYNILKPPRPRSILLKGAVAENALSRGLLPCISLQCFLNPAPHFRTAKDRERGGYQNKILCRLWKMASWQAMKVPELRAELKHRDLPHKGVKATLTARLKHTDGLPLNYEDRKTHYELKLKEFQAEPIANVAPFPYFNKFPLEIQRLIVRTHPG